MKLAVFTNIPANYQVVVGQALAEALPGQFAMVCWEQTHAERTRLGWVDEYSQDWLLRAWASEEKRQAALEILRSAETVIWGYAPLAEINQRVLQGKLTFRYTERPFKRGRWRLISPRVLKSLYEIYRLSNRSAYHLLAVGPHCAGDFKLLGMFRRRIWRWGYFPEAYSFGEPRRPSEVPTILWAGRMIDWKRVDLLLEAAAWARARGGQPFRLRLIGYGPEEEKLRGLAARLGLTDLCSFEGPMPPQEIWRAMHAAELYVLPSDRNEGWGVVVNEAMSQGCCVVGNAATGSVPWLIQDGVNGRAFTGGNPADLGRVLCDCLADLPRTRAMGAAAQKTIAGLWSPEVAAGRLLELIAALQAGRPSPFQDAGPGAAA